MTHENSLNDQEKCKDSNKMKHTRRKRGSCNTQEATTKIKRGESSWLQVRQPQVIRVTKIDQNRKHTQGNAKDVILFAGGHGGLR
mmetsp:Transcript_17273/g.34168  ORF Transcript_17273/g.34168 Transcript_17273/m.34168 type:complete len:85 (-) Transcript_17273:37-291(-)